MKRDSRKLLVNALIWALAGAMLWFALHDMNWKSVRIVLGQLTAFQIATLFGVNTFIVLLFGARWWLILRALGYKFSLFHASAYRLAAFGVSYFTPGPQIGGEPLQVYLAVRQEGIPVGTATASVVLDRLLDLASNFAFLAFGVSVLLSGGLLEGREGIFGMMIAFGLLLFPLAYLYSLFRGTRPLTLLLHKISSAFGNKISWTERTQTRLANAGHLIRSSETEAVSFVSTHKFAFAVAVLLSGIIWVALIIEYILAIRFLGLELGFNQVVSVMTAARLAILLPIPGGLGALEAALVLVTRLIGQGAALGAGLSLVIRVRDIMFGLMGLWLGRRLANSK